MAYGSGRPAWGGGGDVEEGGLSRRTPHNSNGSINNNSNNNNNGSYQQGGARSYQSNYQAPQLSGTYTKCCNRSTRTEGITTKGVGQEETFVWDHWTLVGG